MTAKISDGFDSTVGNDELDIKMWNLENGIMSDEAKKSV